jgi:hypothetical protein
LALGPSPFALRPSPFALRPSPFALRPLPFALCPLPLALRAYAAAAPGDELVSEISLFALKFKNFGWADNKVRYIFLIIAVVLLILFQVTALPFIILLYIFLSIIINLLTKKEINS